MHVKNEKQNKNNHSCPVLSNEVFCYLGNEAVRGCLHKDAKNLAQQPKETEVKNIYSKKNSLSADSNLYLFISIYTL